MATKITLQHPRTGETITGFYGFSWTTLFFGPLPALFRKDFQTFVCVFFVLFVLALLTFGIGPIIAALIWGFMYNKYFTVNRIKQGFKLASTNAENELAAGRLGLTLNAENCATVAATKVI
ncbi:hypothetical protein ACSI5N_25535 (plasmid) [Raoultella ornithinolytica]|uniref:hypothetical protein n=1 Tax=Raoultella ornithinolytica TaxID=54291 RepID=UPI00292BDEB9|nr:hypothetical protein [Raoultella ornithinolytica]MDV1094989.1 hypothetical protein [Raoultella ornithinolytica]MDV1122667.1 hypothetical protein [Raoultella ornithinolytica]MDV1893182.1 hypothetical protein [Raoultella ornithinolytica]